MRRIYPYLALVFLFSCEDSEKIQSDISKLRQERNSLINQVGNLKEIKSDLEEEVKELKIYNKGRTPYYIIKVRLKQSHISLDITKHVKDEMNAIEFELPVSKDFYNEVEVGTNITNEFRMGSLIMNGSFGNWKMTVINKQIR